MNGPIESFAVPSHEACAICLEEFSSSANKICALLVCKHIFHKNCVESWLVEHKTCPTCRFKAIMIKQPVEILKNVISLYPIVGGIGGSTIGLWIKFFQQNIGRPSLPTVFSNFKNCLSKIADICAMRSFSLEVSYKCIDVPLTMWANDYLHGCLKPMVDNVTNATCSLIANPTGVCAEFLDKAQEIETFIEVADRPFEFFIASGAGVGVGLLISAYVWKHLKNDNNKHAIKYVIAKENES